MSRSETRPSVLSDNSRLIGPLVHVYIIFLGWMLLEEFELDVYTSLERFMWPWMVQPTNPEKNRNMVSHSYSLEEPPCRFVVKDSPGGKLG